jgi:hypothetical protein
MPQSLSSIRKAIATKIETLSGFKESKHTPDFFGRTENTVAHKAFSISVASSTAMEERQRRAVGVYLTTPMQVIFSYRLRPLDIYPTDYDASLDAEEQVINKILEVYATDNEFTIRYTSSERSVTDSQEYILITLSFNILHTI